jgi:hypothetical protein
MSIASRITSFLVRFFIVLFSSSDYKDSDAAIWEASILRALTSDSIHIRKAMSESLLKQILEIHSPAFKVLLSGTVSISFGIEDCINMFCRTFNGCVSRVQTTWHGINFEGRSQSRIHRREVFRYYINPIIRL